MPGAHRVRPSQDEGAPTVNERLWGPAVAGAGAVLATILGMGVTSMMLFFGMHASSEELWPGPPAGANYGGYVAVYAAAVVWFGLVSLIALLYGLLLQAFGESAHYRISLLVILPPVVVADVLVRLGYSALEVGHLLATAVWAFVLVRWRLTGRPLRRRLPVALVLYPALVVILILAVSEGTAQWYRHMAPERLDAAILDHPEWEAVSAHYYNHNGVFTSAYRHEKPGGEQIEVYVDTYPPQHPDPARACGPDWEECVSHGELWLFAGDDSEAVFGVYYETVHGVASLRWRRGPEDTEAVALADLGEHLRTSTEGDRRWLARLLAS